MQSALDNWRPGTTTIPNLASHHTRDDRSFGETHASELSRVNSMASMASTAQVSHAQVGHMATPQTGGKDFLHPGVALSDPAPLPHTQNSGISSATAHTPSAFPVSFSPPSGPPPRHPTSGQYVTSPALDTSKLNNAPALIPQTQHSVSSVGTPATVGHGNETTPVPIPSQSGVHSTLSPAIHQDTAAHHILPNPHAETPIGAPSSGTIPPADLPTSATAPTVAETGLPIVAGTGGPGPISGSLSRDNTTASSSSAAPDYGAFGSGGFRQDPEIRHESAEEEKHRLAREERERLLNAPLQNNDAPGYSPGEYGGQYGDDKKKDKDGSAGGPPPSGTPPPYV